MSTNFNYQIMKNYIVLIFLFFGTAVFAQDNENPQEEKSVEEMALLSTKRLALALDLNATQQEKLIKLQKKRMEDLREIRSDAKNDREENSKKREETLTELQSEKQDVEFEFQENLKEILTEEQYTKWKDIQNKRLQGRNTNSKIREN